MSATMGQIIKALRRDRGLTQEELAEQIGVTSQAVSKWENDYGMPDISQIVPLATTFNVTTDFLFGMDKSSENEETLKIVSKANSIQKYGNPDTYLEAYDILMSGLKKYPNNYTITYHCMNLGVALSLPENEWIYSKERAKTIIPQAIRHANFVISNSNNISEIFVARYYLVLLYSANKQFDLATAEARKFPVRTDFSLYSVMAIVNEYIGNYDRVSTYLCSDIDYQLQAFENNVARLGTAYFNRGNYTDSIEVLERFFEVMNAIFKDECPPPYHDFDSGDCYLLLARAYLAVGEENKAMDALERSVMYYIDILKKQPDSENCYPIVISSPLVKKSEFKQRIPKDIIKKRLFDKLSDKDIRKLKHSPRFMDLQNIIDRQGF